MSRWWRAYDEAVDDPKLVMLSDKQHRAWFNLMCVTSANDGTLPDLKVLAVKLRMPVGKVSAVVEELRAAGLIDEVDGVLSPHNWNGRQFKHDVSTERVKRFRERRETVSPAVSETAPDTEYRDREQKTDKNATRASALTWPFDQFWAQYPHKVGRRAALKAFQSVERSGAATFAELMAGLERYVASKPPDRQWCNPATWLNQGRWDDQPAATGPPASIAQPISMKDRRRQEALDVSAALREYASQPEGSSDVCSSIASFLPARRSG